MPHRLDAISETASTVSPLVTSTSEPKITKQRSIPGLELFPQSETKYQVVDSRIDLAAHSSSRANQMTSSLKIDLDLSSGAKKIGLVLPQFRSQNKNNNNYFCLLSCVEDKDDDDDDDDNDDDNDNDNDNDNNNTNDSLADPLALFANLASSLENITSASLKTSSSLPPCATILTTSSHLKLQRPLQYWDVYVDNFFGLVQGNKYR